MINVETLEKIKILEQKYVKTWGKEVDYSIIPRGMTQEMLLHTLERMINTNESIIVAFSKAKAHLRNT